MQVALMAHDLVVLLDPKQIVSNIHDAYEHPHFKLRPYSVLRPVPLVPEISVGLSSIRLRA